MSYRRKPVSRNIIWLQKHWTPAFAGVTTFYEVVIHRREEIKDYTSDPAVKDNRGYNTITGRQSAMFKTEGESWMESRIHSRREPVRRRRNLPVVKDDPRKSNAGMKMIADISYFMASIPLTPKNGLHILSSRKNNDSIQLIQ